MANKTTNYKWQAAVAATSDAEVAQDLQVFAEGVQKLQQLVTAYETMAIVRRIARRAALREGERLVEFLTGELQSRSKREKDD